MTKDTCTLSVSRMDQHASEDDSGISDVVASIQRGLEQGLRMGNKQVRRAAVNKLQKRSEIKVKCEFGGEKRVLSMSRPVQFAELVDKLTEMYQMTLNLFFTQCNGEIYIPLKNQKDLDSAVQLVDQNDHTSSLRLYLTPEHAGPTRSFPGQTINLPPELPRQSPSPPPGSLPMKDSYMRTNSFTPVEGEGQFIPEPSMGHDMDYYHHHREGSLNDSVSSLDGQSVDSCYVSGHSNDTYGRRRDSRRSVLSENSKDEVSLNDNSRKHFGTFPRGFEAAQHDSSIEGKTNGRQTFPRSTFRRPDTESTSLRSLMSHSSEGTLDSASRSSSSSGFPTEPDWDSPGSRVSFTGGPLFHKCKFPFYK